MRKLACLLLIVCFSLVTAHSNTAGQNVSPDKEKVIVVDRTDYPLLYVNDPPLQGDAVWMTQARLRELGYDIQPNGSFDAFTSSMVGLFQVANGLEADGKVSEEVWDVLFYGPGGEPSLPADSKAPDNKKMMIEIDVSTRTLRLFEEGKEIAKYPIAVGTRETPTPLGEWRVVQKCLNWGNGFGTRWLGLNVPWGIFGIHGTDKPYSIGTYASHGCIRMFNRDVEKLYPQVPMGIMVRIVDNGKIFPKDLKPIPLKKNSSGQKVVYVQSRLKELGIEFDIADGRYGNMTELAVKYFQVWHGLKPTGEMDEETYRAMGMIK